MAKARVKAPKTAAVGEVIPIKTLISHPMDSGHRKDRETGELIPRKIINRFVASFEGQTVFTARMEPSISANPYFKFTMKVPERAPGPGTLRFEWTDDDGTVYDLEKEIIVT